MKRGNRYFPPRGLPAPDSNEIFRSTAHGFAPPRGDEDARLLTIVDRIADLTDDQLADFPLGIARLGLDGTVLSFNKAEEIFANRRADDTIGLNYFRDVAPCAAVREFHGRFIALAEGPPGASESFAFTYPFWLGDRRVTITLVRRSADPQFIHVVTEMQVEVDGA